MKNFEWFFLNQITPNVFNSYMAAFKFQSVDILETILFCHYAQLYQRYWLLKGSRYIGR
jgi:hypothetical protein